MRFKSNFFKRYITVAPLPLALERSWECEIMSAQNFRSPILDIGCGEGLFAWNLVDEQIDVAIDPNARELDRARRFNLYGELIECFGNKIPKADKFFQTIYSNSVMEHIPNIEPALKEAHRLLNDNGAMYLTLPTDQFNRYTLVNQILLSFGLEGLAKKFRTFFNRFWAHYHDYSAADWRSLFERNGFEVKESFEYGSKGQVMFNDFATPFCLPALIVKKVNNSWFLIPAARGLFTSIIHVPLFSGLSRLQKQPEGQGGLVFFALEKK
jgi:ubiquinone/menaquinone biosynthesis C-methylase UbiE